MKKRIFSILVMIALLIASVSVKNQEAIVAQAEETSEDGFIEITNVSELYAIRNNLSGKYRLMNDIDLTEATSEGGEVNNTGHGWDPIDNFSGVLDGNGHYIKGMQIYGEVEDNLIGLFGKTIGDDTEIRNLGMVDVNIDVSNSSSVIYCGGLVGYFEDYDNLAINNCFVTGTITVTGTENCETCNTGGFVGCAMWGLNITNCFNAASISAVDENGNYYSGTSGFSGYNYYGHGSYSTQVKNSYNVGIVNGGTGYPIGPNLRMEDKEWGVSGSANIMYLIGTASQGCGTPFTESQMKNANYFTNWDFDEIWEIDEYSNYPYPQLRSCPKTRVRSIEIVTYPSKLEYNQGEDIDFSDATVKVTYEDGYNTTIFLTEDLIEDTYDTSVIGNQDVIISKGQASTTVNITINPIPVQEVRLDKNDISIYKGYSEQLIATVFPDNATDKNISWSSADESIAAVDQNGKVTAKGKGTTTITASSKEGVQATCQITVTIPCVMLQLDNYNVTLNKGESYKMTYKVSPLDCTDTVTWKSSDENVLRIDADNNWIGINAGIVTVTGTTDSGVTSLCTVTVMQDLSEFTVLDIKDKTYTGKVITQKPKVTNGTKTLQAGVDYTISYSSNVNVGTASMTITGISPYKGSITKTFNILGSGSTEKVSKVNLSKVRIASIKTSKKKLTIRWKKVNNAVGYEVQIARNKKFTKGRKKYYVTANTLKKVFKGAKKKTYYVRVRAYAYDTEGQTFNGAFSSIKKKKTK